MGKVHFFRGELRAAEAALDAALADRGTLATDDLLTHHQYPVSAMVYGAFTTTLLGRPAAGAELLDQALAVSRTSAPFTHSLTLANALLIDLARGGGDERPELLGELARIAAARGAPFWNDLVAFHEGWDAVRTDSDVENGLARMHRGLLTFAENAVEIEVPFYEAILAAELLRLGRFDEGGRLLDDAEARIARTRERWALVEVLRLRLLLRARSGDGEGVDDLLAEARAVAIAQEAGWWRQRLEATAAELGWGSADQVA
jgi:hypothetical protein